MSDLNRASLLGRLGKDPELRFTQGGRAVCRFSLATSESWKDKDGQKQEKTQWHNVVVWGGSAEACGQHLVKGQRVYVDGRIETRKYEKDGREHWITEIIATDVKFLDRPRGEGAGTSAADIRESSGGARPAPQEQRTLPGTADDDDIPF